jgi:hypothetical protein
VVNRRVVKRRKTSSSADLGWRKLLLGEKRKWQ